MIAAQMPAERKRAKSHFTIDNDGSLKALERQARVVFEELRRRAAVAALGRPAHSLLLVGRDATADPALEAMGARYADAGLTVRRIAGSAAAIDSTLSRPDAAPDAIVATRAAAAATEDAWGRGGRRGVLVWLSDDPDPVAVRLDLRPWGHERLRLVEAGGAGLAPRPDLFPSSNPLA
jgi:hypothetical protein